VSFVAKRKLSISLVIPLLNDAETLSSLFSRMPAWVDEALFVKTSSAAGPFDSVLNVRPDVRMVTHLGTSTDDPLQTGLAAATGDIIVLLDTEGSPDPGEILSFVETLLVGPASFGDPQGRSQADRLSYC
jgi:hypothetical protein